MYILTQNSDKSFSPIIMGYKMTKKLPKQVGFGDYDWINKGKSISNGILAGIGATALLSVLL